MFKEAILTFVCFILFVKGKPNLIFLEGSEKLVSSIQIIRNGTNFTVTCVIEDLKSKTKPLDLIFWTNCDLSTKRREVHSITLCTPGSYCCISDKYKLIKRFHLIVRDGHDFVRRKRSEYQFSNQYRNAISDLNHFGTLDSPVTIPSVLRDLFDGPSKKASNKNQNIYIHDDDLYMSNSGGNVITNNNNYHTNYGGNNVLTSYPESNNKELLPPVYESNKNILLPHVNEYENSRNTFNVKYFFAIVGVFVLIGLVFVYGSKSEKHTNREENPELSSYLEVLTPNNSMPLTTIQTDDDHGGFAISSSLIRNNETDGNLTRPCSSNTNNQMEPCNHVFCARHRGTNGEVNPELGCYRAVLTPNIQSDDDGGVPIVTSLIRNNGTDGNLTRPCSSNTNNQIEPCNHVFCSRHRDTNGEVNPELGYYLAMLTPNTQSDDDGGVPIVTSLIRNNGTDGNPVRPYSDLPPAYEIATRNSPLHSREDVLNEIDVPPPSYHQAVSNMNLDPPPDFDSNVNQASFSITSASSSNVSHVRAPPLRAPVVDPEF